MRVRVKRIARVSYAFLFFLLLSLHTFNVLWEFSQGAFEDLLNLPHFALALLLVVYLFIMSLYHVHKLVYIAAWNYYVTNFLLRHHLLLGQKCVLLLFKDHTPVDG